MTLSSSEAKRIGKARSIENHVWKPLQTLILHSKSDWRMTTLETPDRIRSALACQIGTEHYWKVFPDDDAFKITDGVKWMFISGGFFPGISLLQPHLVCKQPLICLHVAFWYQSFLFESLPLHKLRSRNKKGVSP